jgi:uncharacterized protein YceK
MIRKEGVRIIITCNGCGQVRTDQDGQRAKWRPYPAVWKEAQAEGWTAKKNATGKDFDHFCPECK